ncbi:MAG TPA: hypothetical protein VN456_12165 [Desulfosporosinus sp.]|nr:hypothetical protein [Desulfosporosinus sp.]
MVKTMSETLEATAKSLSIKEAAKILNISEQFIRIGLQRGILPFGHAVKMSTKWTYHISKHKLFEYLGIKEVRLKEADPYRAAQPKDC